MAFTITKKVTDDGTSIEAGKDYETGTNNAKIILSESVPVAAETQYIIAIDVSQIKAIFITSDQDVTIETNNSGVPDNTLALKANVPYEWTTDSYFSNVFTVDVTKVYITNASAAAAAVKIRVLYDTTP